MGLSKYPEKLDLFETKRNATYENDPNGDFVMAEDINILQDAITAIEKSLGVNPQGSKVNVNERISLLEGSSSLRVPSFLIYLGKPALINESETTLEAAGHFSKYDHVVLGNNAQDPTDSDHQVTLEVIDLIRQSKNVNFYGYIDCGVNTLNLSITEINNQVRQWKNIDATGIYCANIGYENRVSRDRQNQILDIIHENGMVAILDGENPEELFTDLFHVTYNPSWKEPNVTDGDIYHYNHFALDTSTQDIYEPNQVEAILMLIKLYDYRVNKGVRIFATPVIQTTVEKALAQKYYDYAHVTALVTSMDAFHPVTEDYGQVTNVAPTFEWMPIAGSWYMSSPRIEYDARGVECVRELPFGRIFLNTEEHTYRYEGIYIPFELLRIAQNSIDGELLKDNSVPDTKIKEYSGSRLISSINANMGSEKINVNKIMDLNYDNIEGDIPASKIQANVIDALNANIGRAVIDSAVIGNLDASKITTGTLDAAIISASVVNAINLYAETMTAQSARIGEAAIGNLNAEKITAGTIDAERISSSVVEAINLSAQQGYIENLNADNITAGNILAERIQAEVVNAINMYTETMVAGSAKIGAAVIDDLTADHIRTSVIEAINGRIDSATINSAKIAELSASHITASVIEAINLSVTNATIDAAKIGDLSADKITAGTIDADRIKGSIIDALDLYASSLQAGDAVINNALIQNLDASQITTGNISADLIKTNVIEAINAYAQTIQADSALINVAAIGNLTAGHIQSVIFEAINGHVNSLTIDAAKIGSLRASNIQAEVIRAINASIENAVIDAAKISDLSAEKITAGILEADIIKGSVIEAINGSFEGLVIDAAMIGSLDVDNMKAGVIEAVNASIDNATINAAKIGSLGVDNLQASVVEAINASISTAVIDAAKIANLTAAHIEAIVIDAVNANIGEATIDNALIGQLSVDNMRAQVIEAINSYTGLAVIGEARIGNLSAGKITTGSIDAERIKTTVVEAINASIDTVNANHAKIEAAAIGNLSAENIQAVVIEAVNASIGEAVIDSAKIGELTADNMKAEVISAVNASLENAVISSAKIGTLTADHIKSSVVEAVNLSAGSAKISSAKIDTLTASHINTSVIQAINASVENIKINYGKIGLLKAENIEAEAITSDAIRANAIQSSHIAADAIKATHIEAGVINALHLQSGTITSEHITTAGLDAAVIKTGYIDAARIRVNSIDASKILAGSITGREIAANVITSREIQTGSITSNEIAAGSISAEHITTQGLDAQTVSVYNGRTGETLIGGGYLRVDGLDSGVVQSDNLVANGMFMTASSGYGIKRKNPTGEVIIGTESKVPGGNQIWKYDLETGQVINTIDVPGKKPAFIAIDYQQKYAYATVQGNDSLVQIDLDYDVITENSRPLGKAPSRLKWTGNILGDMKHLFAINSDITDITSPDSFHVLDVPPHSDFSQLYVHHQLVLGNGPYDFVLSEKNKYLYITLKDQGDIAIIDASSMDTWKWKQVGAIPIAPYGTDNYHGGLVGNFGLGHAVGGDSSSSYNMDNGSHGAGHSHGAGGGYTVSDGTMMPYEPHGIAIDTNENLLLVTDAMNNELVIISRVPQEEYEWPLHPSYEDETNQTWIANVTATLDAYDNNPEQAIADGFTMVSEYVPYMGYHFARTTEYSPTLPNTLLYVLDTTGTENKYRVIGAEWAVADPSIPSPVPGKDWELSTVALAHYADGLTIPTPNPADAAPMHPETHSAFTHWTPAIYGIHFYHKLPNPVGLFEAYNIRIAPFNDTNPTYPPGFESRVKPTLADTDWRTYVPPASGTGNNGGGSGGGHDHHAMSISSVEDEEVLFEAKHNPSLGIVHDHDMDETIGPDTTGQGTVWNWVIGRIPIGDTPEFVEVFDGKVFVTLTGDNHVVVMNESDLYRAPIEFTDQANWFRYMRDIVVGPRPLDIIKDTTRNKIYVTVNGTNEIAIINPVSEEVEGYMSAGANVMGGSVTPDGRYLYVANNGGIGSMNFVYPEGDYIGDAFVGLEGDINYQGALYWTPDRSDWIHNPDGTLRSSSTVEFRINEPFLNEGGYVRLAAQGLDSQYAQIEQDIYNVSNYSNGNNFADARGERLEGNIDRTLWYPNNEFLMGEPVQNVKIAWMEVQEDESLIRREVIPAPEDFTVYYDVSRIEFPAGYVQSGAWVEADYVFRANVWFKNHNASILIANENSSSRNFSTIFEVDEYVPKFITIDALQTKPFTYEPIVHEGVTDSNYEGLKYSYKTNRAIGLDASAITLSAPQVDTGIGQDPCVAIDGDEHSDNFVELPSGLQSFTLDLGQKHMVGEVRIWHFWQDGRTYHNTKTEVSEDGINWITVFDSAVSGEYTETSNGHSIKFWAHPNKPKNETENYVAAMPVRYVRDWSNGNTVNNANHWVEIEVFADWVLEEHYEYPENTANEGEQIATNNKGVVSTDIPAASITVDLKVDFTCWWYMTYLVGPEFGQYDVEMPTVMGGTHVLPVTNPYINKVAHRHIMSFPPGMHKTIVKQKSGKVSIDRFRFEDYQYYDRSAVMIPSTAGTTFKRYKIVPEQAKNYVGQGNQSTEGPYDTPRVNPDTQQPDSSVAVKYRMRVKSVLSAEGEEDERGVAYATSAIFEQGKLSSHWRPSAASDMTPGNRIESWDGNQPAKTGIQSHHLANGSVRGPKILPSAIMDYHVSPYAKIGEYKLDLNYPTHQHGHMMTASDGSKYFMDNKDIIDGIMGWGDSGKSTKMARADHGHSHMVGDLMIHGNLELVNTHALNDWALINNVNVWQLNEDFNAHIIDEELHLTPADRVLLNGLVSDATRVEASSTNGNIIINGSQVSVYTHPTTAGNKHIPTGGSSGNVLKYASSGTASWGSVEWSEISSKPSTFAPSAHTHTAAEITDLSVILSNYATIQDLTTAGSVSLTGTNIFSGQNVFTKHDGPAIMIQPSTLPDAETLLFKMNDTTGASMITFDATGNVVINANLTVRGTTTYNGTNSIDGDYDVSGNLTVAGSTTLGSSASDQTTVKGSLVVEGGIIQKGKSEEVARFTVFGTAGDLQFQTDSTTYENIISHYSTFSVGSDFAIPSVPVGATRKYRLQVSYSTVGTSSNAKLRIVQYGSSTTVMNEITLPSVNGVATGMVRHFKSDEFTTSFSGNTTFQALSAGVNKDLVIKHIEVIAYDYYA